MRKQLTIFVINDSLRPIGGAEVYVRSNILALSQAGHRLLAVSADSERPEGLEGLAEWRAIPDLFVASLRPSSLRRARVAARAISSLLAQYAPDVCLLHILDSPLALKAIQSAGPTIRFVHTAWPYCPAGTRWLPRSNRECTIHPGLGCLVTDTREKCLVTLRGERYGLKNSLRRILDLRFQAQAFHRATLIAANSRYTASQIEGLIGPSQKVIVLPPPVPASAAVPQPPIRGRLLVAGRLITAKGIADAIRVAAAIPDATLVIAGEGPMRADFEQLARSLRADDRIQFLGWVTRPQLDEEMQKAEVVLFPSTWPETFGQVGAQAGSNGRPVVGYAGGGVTEWLSDLTGVLVPAGDVEAMTRATAELLANPERAHRLGDAARVAFERYALPAFAARLQEAITRVVALGARATR